MFKLTKEFRELSEMAIAEIYNVCEVIEIASENH